MLIFTHIMSGDLLSLIEISNNSLETISTLMSEVSKCWEDVIDLF